MGLPLEIREIVGNGQFDRYALSYAQPLSSMSFFLYFVPGFQNCELGGGRKLIECCGSTTRRRQRSKVVSVVLDRGI